MNKNDKRFQRAEAAFKDALVRLCRIETAADISVSELVETSGYSRSAFYAHYDGMEGFFQHILRTEAEMFVQMVTYSQPKIVSINMRDLESFSIQKDTEFFSYVYENRDLYNLLLHDKLMPGTIDWIISYAIECIFSRVTRIEKHYYEISGQKWTIQNLYEPLDPELITRMTLSVYFSLIRYWEKTDYRYSPHHLAIQRINSRHQLIPFVQGNE